MKPVLATLVGAFTCLFTGTIIAIAMQPFIGPLLTPHIRTEAEGLLFPSLLTGYFVVGAMLVAIGVLTEASEKSWLWIFKMGAALGLAIFLGDLQRDKQDENPASIMMRTRGWCLAGRA